MVLANEHRHLTAARIRRGVAGDADVVAAFGARAFEAAFGADNRPEDMRAYLASSFDRGRVTAELADPASTYLLAEDGEDLAGYAVLRDGPAPRPLGVARAVEIVRLYASPERIGAGYGAALMQACLDEARRAGHASVWLGVWERNARAIAFYRRWRFEVVGSHEFLLGDDLQNDLIMARDLDADPG